VLLVSHDQALVSEVATELWVVNEKTHRIAKYEGTFEDYRKQVMKEALKELGDDDDEEDA
jgi:ATPase subunit of ABC transporter with duplicated ATPase domains